MNLYLSRLFNVIYTFTDLQSECDMNNLAFKVWCNHDSILFVLLNGGLQL